MNGEVCMEGWKTQPEKECPWHVCRMRGGHKRHRCGKCGATRPYIYATKRIKAIK